MSTLPPMPGVRRSRSAEAFYRWLEEGRVPLPWGCALTVDAYDAYTLFCQAHCLGPPSPLNDFAYTLQQARDVRRAALRLPELGACGLGVLGAPPGAARQRRVLLIGWQPSGDAVRGRRRVRREVRRFRLALVAWRHALAAEPGDGYPQPQREPSPCEIA